MIKWHWLVLGLVVTLDIQFERWSLIFCSDSIRMKLISLFLNFDWTIREQITLNCENRVIKLHSFFLSIDGKRSRWQTNDEKHKTFRAHTIGNLQYSFLQSHSIDFFHKYFRKFEQRNENLIDLFAVMRQNCEKKKTKIDWQNDC